MCLGCVEEKALEVARTVADVCQEGYGLAARDSGPPGRFEVQVTRHKSLKRQMAENSKAAEAARKYAEEVTRRQNALIFPGTCKRGQLLHGNLRGTFSGVDVDQYIIFDERAKVTPAAQEIEN
jgi:hypothetical protein